MFWPAGEEPCSDYDESSGDEYLDVAMNGLEELPKDEKPRSIWNTTDISSSVLQSNPTREHVMVQTSMGNENFRMAIMKSDVDNVNQMLSSGFDVETRLKGGWTPLMYACENGSFSIVQLLITKGANCNSHKDTFTPLMCLSSCKSLSCEDDLVSCAKLLIEEGARVNARDRHYMSPLMYACKVGHMTLAQVLLSSGADPNFQDTRGWTALCYVATTGNKALASLLLENGTNTKLATHIGDTPTSIALTAGYTSLASVLDGKTVAPPTNPDDGSCTNPLIEGSGSLEASVSRQLNELELFLAGLKLRQLEPVFQSHCVDFQRLLTLTDEDLNNMGITQIGVRKTLIDAITDLHKASWRMPDKPFEVRRGLSIEEYSVVLCQLGSHVKYVSSSTAFLINHTSPKYDSSCTPFAMVTTKQQSQELIKQVDLVAKAGRQLLENITTLEKEVYKELGTTAPSMKKDASKLTQVMKTVGFTFGLSFFGFVVYCLATKKPMMPMMEQWVKSCQRHCPAVLNQFL